MANKTKVADHLLTTAKPKLLPDPLACPAGYSLDAYCKYQFEGHEFNEFPHSFIGQTDGQCRTQAKRNGWKFHRDGTATCPKCVRALGL